MGNSDHIYIEIGKRIQQARIKSDLTQARLAEIVSLTRTSITNIEKGRQKLLIHTIYNFANALGIHPTDLLPEEVEQTTGTIDQKLPKDLSKKERSWVKSFMEGGSKHGDSKKND